MIDLLENDPCDNHFVASLLLAQAGLPCGPEVCECGSCPIEITEFKIDVHRILITANGRQFELLVNADRADRDEIREALRDQDD